MLAIRFTFTANRYHATQWGRHVNEGVLEWPPSPWRILRSIVAVWRRTRTDLAPVRVVPILEALASERPKFKLPVASTGHTRHYMPYNEGARERTTLVIDSFISIKPKDPMYVLWPSVELARQQRDDLDSILRNMPCLGRAESWVDAEVAPNFSGEPNSYPMETGELPEDCEIVRTLTPRNQVKLEDLEVETSRLRSRGRIDPEGAEWWAYLRKRDCFAEFRRYNPPLPDRGEDGSSRALRSRGQGAAHDLRYSPVGGTGPQGCNVPVRQAEWPGGIPNFVRQRRLRETAGRAQPCLLPAHRR